MKMNCPLHSPYPSTWREHHHCSFNSTMKTFFITICEMEKYFQQYRPRHLHIKQPKTRLKLSKHLLICKEHSAKQSRTLFSIQPTLCSSGCFKIVIFRKWRVVHLQISLVTFKIDLRVQVTPALHSQDHQRSTVDGHRTIVGWYSSQKASCCALK